MGLIGRLEEEMHRECQKRGDSKARRRAKEFLMNDSSSLVGFFGVFGIVEGGAFSGRSNYIVQTNNDKTHSYRLFLKQIQYCA